MLIKPRRRLLTGVLAAVSIAGLALAGEPPQVGSPFPSILVPTPEDPPHKRYLGLPEKKSFNVSEVSARVLIIEIFSMYCPFCQREAPSVNKLFETMNSEPTLREKVKLLGIGAGNSNFEVEIFRNKFGVKFPLIPDPDYKLHKALGEVRTPYFFVLSLSPQSQPRVIYSKLGGIGNIQSFLKMIKPFAEHPTRRVEK